MIDLGFYHAISCMMHSELIVKTEGFESGQEAGFLTRKTEVFTTADLRRTQPRPWRDCGSPDSPLRPGREPNHPPERAGPARPAPSPAARRPADRRRDGTLPPTTAGWPKPGGCPYNPLSRCGDVPPPGGVTRLRI